MKQQSQKVPPEELCELCLPELERAEMNALLFTSQQHTCGGSQSLFERHLTSLWKLVMVQHGRKGVTSLFWAGQQNLEDEVNVPILGILTRNEHPDSLWAQEPTNQAQMFLPYGPETSKLPTSWRVGCAIKSWGKALGVVLTAMCFSSQRLSTSHAV